MQNGSPYLVLSSEELSSDELNSLTEELVQRLREKKLDAKKQTESGPIRDKSLGCVGVALVEVTADLFLKEAVRKIVEVASDFIQDRKDLKIDFQQSEAIFGADAPVVQISWDSLLDGDEPLVKRVVKTFGSVAGRETNGRLALIAGVEKYSDNRICNLKHTVSGAKKVADVLSHPGHSGFKIASYLENPSRNDLAAQIEAVLRNAKSDDLVLFYYSGHGVRGPDRKLYLTGSDTEEKSIMATALPISTIVQCLKVSKCRTFVAILDCCYAADANEDLKTAFDDFEADSKTSKKSQYWLFGANTNEHASENDLLQSSIFTKYFCDGIQYGHADLNKDGEISIEELDQYVGQQVSHVESRDIAAYRINSTGKDIIIAHNRQLVLKFQHDEHARIIADLYDNGVIGSDLRQQWLSFSKTYADDCQTNPGQDERERWKTLCKLAENSIAPADAVLLWDQVVQRATYALFRRRLKLHRAGIAALLAFIILGFSTASYFHGGPVPLLFPAQASEDENVKKIDELKGIIVTLRGQLKTIIKQLEMAKKETSIQITTLKETKSALQKKAAEAENLRTSLFAANSRSEKQRTQLAEMSIRAHDLQTDLREEEKAKAQKNLELDKANTKIADLKQDNELYAIELNRLAGETSELEAKNSELTQSLKEARASLEEREQSSDTNNLQLIALGPQSVQRDPDNLAVKKLQNALYEMGCYNGYVDGDPGDQTYKALGQSISLDAEMALRRARKNHITQNQVSEDILNHEYGQLLQCDRSQIQLQKASYNSLKERGLTRIRGRFPKDNDWAQIEFGKDFWNRGSRLSVVDAIGTVDAMEVEFSNGSVKKLSRDDFRTGYYFNFTSSKRSFVLRLKRREDIRGEIFSRDYSVFATVGQYN